MTAVLLSILLLNAPITKWQADHFRDGMSHKFTTEIRPLIWL